MLDVVLVLHWLLAVLKVLSSPNDSDKERTHNLWCHLSQALSLILQILWY